MLSGLPVLGFRPVWVIASRDQIAAVVPGRSTRMFWIAIAFLGDAAGPARSG